MNTEKQFFQAIAKDPENKDLRLVFADWLDERGDPRGEWIRIEEECKRHPAYSKKYWKLKPGRNKLRQKADPESRKKLGYGEAYAPVFYDCPKDPDSRWRAIRAFTERWFEIELPDIGRVPADVQRLCKTMNRKTLPKSVVHWMAYTEDITGTPAAEMLRDGRSIEYLPDYKALSLNLHSEGDLHWAVQTKKMNVSDPPVLPHLLDRTFVTNEQKPVGLVSEFSISYLWSCLRCGVRGFGTSIKEPNSFLEKLEKENVSITRLGDLIILEGQGWIGKLAIGTGIFGNSNQMIVQVQKQECVKYVPKPISNPLTDDHFVT